MSLFLKEKVTLFPKKKVVKSEKVTPSEEVDKGTKHLDYMIEAVVKIHREYLDNFEGQSIGSTDWFNPDNEFQKESFLQLERNSIKNSLKILFKVRILNHIKRLK